MGKMNDATKKTDPRILRVDAAMNATGTRAKKLAVVKKKAAKRMKQSAVYCVNAG